ncbi:cutinase family protein [Thermomonospora sp. CIF 1]|uniref:cutinase family protein n=1 Tax=Thermomonospora sp. CIF 1 TaxID=1916083 RepID=UPI000B0565D9|nr:cutinase family protein [Thermomonospora sp. CIF 1]PKK14962.1 MAG: cutinase [Thermomonospora sp. CIF 1]
MRSFTSAAFRLIARVTALAGVAAGGLVALATTSPAAAACSEVEMVAARGTFEPGRLGVIVGDPVFRALQGELRGTDLTSYPVDYPADASPTSPRQGVQDLVRHVTQQARECPNQKFVLVGYSQGASVVNGAIGTGVVGGATELPREVRPQIAAVLLFGNPARLGPGEPDTGEFADRTLDICNQGDPVCGAGVNIAAHLAYRSEAGRAAQFAAQKIRGAGAAEEGTDRRAGGIFGR